MRIGLNTGTAVVGQVHSRADAGVTVLGDAVNFAARLQALAEPEHNLISENTHRLVLGMVDTTFAGEHTVKGKSEPQKIYRLDAIRQGAARFEAAVSRGPQHLRGTRTRTGALGTSACGGSFQSSKFLTSKPNPGLGNPVCCTNSVNELTRSATFILSGNCSPDSEQSPFFPFIEVVRASFRLSRGEAEKDVQQKLGLGLTSLGLHSTRNLGLLLHLLGLRVPEGALTGLDGVLIGLRTRELLQQLLESSADSYQL